jgi:cysteine desulfuration protein SufE
MKTIQEIQAEFISAFNELEDWLFQYEFLLQIAGALEPFPKDKKTEEYLVKGCQSKVWLYCELQNGHVHIWCDSEALIIKGMIGVAVAMFHDQSPQDIIQADVNYVEKTALKRQITTDRFHGLKNIVEAIKQFARGCSSNIPQEQA